MNPRAFDEPEGKRLNLSMARVLTGELILLLEGKKYKREEGLAKKQQNKTTTKHIMYLTSHIRSGNETIHSLHFMMAAYT